MYILRNMCSNTDIDNIILALKIKKINYNLQLFITVEK